MIVAFSVSTMGENGSDSVGEVVAECVRIVRDSGLSYETNAMFTNVEGEWEDLQQVLGRCLEKAAEYGPRVSMVVKVDHRPGREGGQIEAKRRRVEEVLGDGAELPDRRG